METDLFGQNFFNNDSSCNSAFLKREKSEKFELQIIWISQRKPWQCGFKKPKKNFLFRFFVFVIFNGFGIKRHLNIVKKFVANITNIIHSNNKNAIKQRNKSFNKITEYDVLICFYGRNTEMISIE
ncbi:hypothetical protein RFI_34233 [Reticulomyxa filosa]|uniref:Uncharacterized protein n=1 Tax=Reticulomyxa filosa TaxID=46433 RepID=X6LPU0_RETFI|nr:hypothetical protein RFI_34233 [Reticulomyxa filosa]|eukprot:ETO03177.1 hypothetical protein RFI_34233 [Reticulomyxa filosa]